MKITFLTAGTGSYYCGACMRDNTLVKALHGAGHEVEMLPMYLPMALDEDVLASARELPVFFGGINVFLQQKIPLFRRTPKWIDRLLNGPGLLRGAAKRSHMTSAREHGEMAVEMLRLESEGKLAKELDKLLAWLEANKPEVLCLSNALQAGMIRELKKRLHVPVICFFQGEDSFVDGLPEPFRDLCWQEMRERLPDAELLVAPSRFYAELMQERLGSPDLDIEVLPNGIDLEGYGPADDPAGPPVIGYLARMMKEKGLALLVEAFVLLRKDLGHPDCRLQIVGTTTKDNHPLVRELQERLAAAGLAEEVSWHQNVSREEKAGLLAGWSLFSVPATYPEAFGLYLLEAMASGVPVVQPDAAAFPEIVEATGGGVLVKPGDAAALAEEWRRLLNDPDERRTLGERGRRGARMLYSADTMRDRFTELARRVAAEQP